MMNIRNLGWKENVEVKFKVGICAKLCLKLWFKSDWYFCNITKSGWLWKRLSWKKVLINHFLKSLQKQACTDVLQNRFFRNFPIFTGKYLESLLNKVAGRKAYIFNTCVFLSILWNCLIINLWWHFLGWKFVVLRKSVCKLLIFYLLTGFQIVF